MYNNVYTNMYDDTHFNICNIYTVTKICVYYCTSIHTRIINACTSRNQFVFTVSYVYGLLMYTILFVAGFGEATAANGCG